jgi:DNA-binding transcriptional regulator YdaS (Cro superfamily)
MNPEDFQAIEGAVATTHADMASKLGISEVSVKRYATGAQPIPAHISKLVVALLLIQNEELQKKFSRLLAKYQRDT